MSLQGEFRFYGGLFNANYRNDDVYYRDPGQNTQYGVGFRGYYAFGNTVGPALYRLSWYDRPFSQWATYTEYQGLMDVTAGTLRAVVWYDIGHDCEIGVTADIATIATASIGVVTAFTYAFVDLGLRWRPVAGFSIGASITNRGMNLNLNHPTLAQLTEPTLLFGSHWDISW